MAAATFRFYGELATFIDRGRRGAAFDYACARAATMKNAIEALGVPHTEVGRLTVNGQPATFPRIVRDGDAIEVFPYGPGDAAAEEAPAFIADAHLGGLARLLRMLGFDTRYDNAAADRDIVEYAARERRIVLTRDRELLKCREIARGCFVHPLKPEAQLRAVAGRYALERCMCPFTLCLHCNLRLVAIGKDEAATRVPDRIAAHYAQFMRCAGCERIYWQGSHWARMHEMLRVALAPPVTAA